MNGRIWTGVVAGVLAAALLLTVGVGAYRAGQEDEAVVRVLDRTDEPGPGEVVRVVGDRDWHPGFFLGPLLIILLVVLLVRAFAGRGRWHNGWYRHGWGPGWHPGWHGPGEGPEGPGGDPRAAWFDEWHRRAHESETGSVSTASTPPPPSGTAPDEPPTPPPTAAGA